MILSKEKLELEFVYRDSYIHTSRNKCPVCGGRKWILYCLEEDEPTPVSGIPLVDIPFDNIVPYDMDEYLSIDVCVKCSTPVFL